MTCYLDTGKKPRCQLKYPNYSQTRGDAENHAALLIEYLIWDFELDQVYMIVICFSLLQWGPEYVHVGKNKRIL